MILLKQILHNISKSMIEHRDIFYEWDNYDISSDEFNMVLLCHYNNIMQRDVIIIIASLLNGFQKY